MLSAASLQLLVRGPPQAEMKDEESIFEEVSEEAYKDIVESRRAARFVEEDSACRALSGWCSHSPPR